MTPANYQSTAVTGESWLRARRIVIEHPLDALPTVKFVEERVVNIIGGDRYSRGAGSLDIVVTEDVLSEVVPILNPMTGEPTGQSMTYGEIYALLHSAYLHSATKRDNPSVQQPSEEDADQSIEN